MAHTISDDWRRAGVARSESDGRSARFCAVNEGGDVCFMVRVTIPTHLKTLARVDGEIVLNVDGVVSQRTVLDALEARYPMLCGTIRDHVTKKRRAFIRFYACEEDLSNEDMDAPLPDAVASGKELFLVIGAMAGG